MPFREIYSVNFANGNLQPNLNLNNWPDMQELVPTDPQSEPLFVVAGRTPDAEGLNLTITRRPAFTGNLTYCVFVLPPEGLTLNRRLLTRVTFDLPRAEKAGPGDGVVEGGGGVIASQPSPSQYATLAAAVLPSEPEQWGVALTLGAADDISGEAVVRVNCQFHRPRNGVRLHTARREGASVGPIQDDQSTVLHSPLDYGNYDGSLVMLDGSMFPLPPSLFTLEHSFCGRNTTAEKYTVGAGFLTISTQFDRFTQEMRDHRVYSSNALTPSSAQPIPIGALAVTLGTTTAGRMSVRLRTFSVWENP